MSISVKPRNLVRLKTIGGLWIEGDGSPSLGPRPLALLALLAAAGKQGISREKLIGILWSETGEEQARHTLAQTRYSLKRETGRDLIEGNTVLRLDPGLSSDIAELKDAAASGDDETAERLYRGRFLEGFYLAGAPEFERWVEEERAAVHRDALRAIERLAARADEDGRAADSVRWWHRLSELDPLSARYATGHMQALAKVGDRSGALAAARLHADTVRRELDAEPDAAVRKLEASLRVAPSAATLPSSPSAPSSLS